MAQAQKPSPAPPDITEFASWGELKPLDKKGLMWQFSPELRDLKRKEVKIIVPPSLVYLEVEGRIYPPGQRALLVHKDRVVLKFVRPQKLPPSGGSQVVTSPKLPSPSTLEGFLQYGVLERIKGMPKGFVFYPNKPGFRFQVSKALEKVDTQTGACRPNATCVIGDVGTLWFKKTPKL
jgi:hypothetical protein